MRTIHLVGGPKDGQTIDVVEETFFIGDIFQKPIPKQDGATYVLRPVTTWIGVYQESSNDQG